MRFIADENIPNSLIKSIRRKGHSIKDLKEENLIGINDNELVRIAKAEKRIILTLDKDFTDLNRFLFKEHNGIVVIRCSDKHSENLVKMFSYLLDSPIKEKFENSLCEIFDNYIKIHKK